MGYTLHPDVRVYVTGFVVTYRQLKKMAQHFLNGEDKVSDMTWYISTPPFEHELLGIDDVIPPNKDDRRYLFIIRYFPARRNTSPEPKWSESGKERWMKAWGQFGGVEKAEPHTAPYPDYICRASLQLDSVRFYLILRSRAGPLFWEKQLESSIRQQPKLVKFLVEKPVRKSVKRSADSKFTFILCLHLI